MGTAGAIAVALIAIVAIGLAVRWLHRRQRTRAEQLLLQKFPGSRED